MIRYSIKLGLLGDAGTLHGQVEHRPGLTLADVLEGLIDRIPRSGPVQVGVDGALWQPERWTDELADDSHVIVAPATTFGLPIAVIVVSALIAAALSVGINYLMGILSPRAKPHGVPQDRGDSTSATYGWDGISTNYGQGQVIPCVWGTMTLGGQVVSTDVQATTAAGVLDDRLRLVLAMCEGVAYRIGGVLVDELDALGGTTGGTPGPPIPADIRVNGNLLENQQTGASVQNITTGVWSGVLPRGAGDVLQVYNPANSQIGLLQIVTANNAQMTDLDCTILSGSVPTGSHVQYEVVNPFSVATVNASSIVIRTLSTPGVRVWIRPGTLDQTPLPSPFAGASTIFSPSLTLNEANDEQVYTYADSTTEVTNVGFVVAFPTGLYALDPQGNLLPYPVQIEAAWRPVGAQSWRSFFLPRTNGQVMPARVIGGQPRMGAVVDTFGGDLTRPGSPPVVGPIEVRLLRRTPSGGSGSVSSGTWRNVAFTQSHTFAYPRCVLVGLELAAGARFSGGLPNVTLRGDWTMVRVWDAVNGFSPRCFDVPAAPFNFMHYPPGRNPAWILLDFLTSKERGLGAFITDADIDLPAFRAWAAFCDSDPNPSVPWNEPAFTCNHAVDASTRAWQTVLTICAAGRASPIKRNGKHSVVYEYRDAHGDLGVSIPAKQSVQLFTGANTERVEVTWLPKVGRPTVLQFQYLNELKQHAQDVLPVEDPESTFNDPTALDPEEYITEVVQAYGVTRPQQLFREGIFRHRANRLIRREIRFVAGPWAVACEPGDLFDFESEMVRPFGSDKPDSSWVTSGGGTGVTVVEVAHAYAGATAVSFRDPDGKPQLRTVSSAVVSGARTTLTLTAGVTVANGAVAVVGLSNKLTETYQCVAITLQSDMKREVRGLQWVPAVHDPVSPLDWDAAGVDLTVGTPSNYIRQPTGYPKASDVNVHAIRGGDHLVTWAQPVSRYAASARVYVRTDVTDSWRLLGESVTADLRVSSLVPMRAYQLSVIVRGWDDSWPVPDAGALLTVSAPEFPPFSPPAITGLTAAAADGLVLVSWDALDLADLRCFEARVGGGWSSGTVVHRGMGTSFSMSSPPMSGTLMVAARSTSGLFGPVATVTLPAWAPPNTASLAALDDLASTPAGTLTGLTYSGGIVTIATGGVSGTYESAVLDAGFQASIYWQVRADLREVDLITAGDARFEAGSGEARWRTADGRPASSAVPGAIFRETAGGVTTLAGDLDAERLGQGSVGVVGAHCSMLVETRFEVDGVWTAYGKHADRRVRARKMQVRVTLQRESTGFDCRLTALRYDSRL